MSFQKLLDYVKTVEPKLKYQILNEARETVEINIIYKTGYLKHFIQEMETTKAWEARGVAEEDYLELQQTAKQINKTYLAKTQRIYNTIK